MANSILANNGANVGGGTLISGNYNIDSDGTGGLGGANDIIANPLLDALADNGGQTNTHALMAGSPAVDPVGLSGAPSVDQRGVSRDATPDIGAFERIGIGPLSDSDAAANQVTENAANGTVVGMTALATDPDVGDSVTYDLVDSAGGRFAIDAITGVVPVANSSLIDFEVATNRTIIVRATSSDTSNSTMLVTVNVLPVNDNTPTITSNGGGATAAVSVAENTTAVTTVMVTRGRSAAAGAELHHCGRGRFRQVCDQRQHGCVDVRLGAGLRITDRCQRG
jgi:hypothetical protein